MSDPKHPIFRMHVTPEWLALVDEWRATQRPIPTRSAAVHTLVGFGLGAATNGAAMEAMTEALMKAMESLDKE